MPQNETQITATGTSGVIVGEFTIVAVTTAAANTTIFVHHLAISAQNLTTFWIATQANVHIYQAYLNAAGHFAVDLPAPIRITAGNGILVRALTPAATYMEATWTGTLVS